jgi:hypothetical protein
MAMLPARLYGSAGSTWSGAISLPEQPHQLKKEGLWATI